MKVFIAGIATETNTFASLPTGLGGFEAMGLRRRDGSSQCALFVPYEQKLRSWAAEAGHELAFGLVAFAQPLGRTVQSVWEALRDELLADLRAAMPVQAVVLVLHGAMASEANDDCEGELIAAVRRVVGPEVPIGVELDLHCHVSEQMVREASLLIAYKEYPHTDTLERLQEVWQLTLATAERRIRPITAVADCRMIDFWHTTREPMRSFVARMQALEGQDGVLSVSFGHGFPWGDVADNGAKVWVVADGRQPQAQETAARVAEQLRRELWAQREHTRSQPARLDDVLDVVAAHLAGSPPIVIADRADNAGGGAMSDSTFVLAGLLQRGIGNVALGAFWDPGAIRCCMDAGVGARFTLRVGGKCGPTSGDPVDVDVIVRAVRLAHAQRGFGGAPNPCGPSVWVTAVGRAGVGNGAGRDDGRGDGRDAGGGEGSANLDAGLDLVLISERQQVLGTDLFTGLGVQLETKRAIVVKSSQHFHAEFAPLASQVLYVDTPGLLRIDMENLPFERRSLNYWPRVADPFANA